MTDWKNKLLAYLHDSPSKSLEVATDKAYESFATKEAGFTDEDILQQAPTR